MSLLLGIVALAAIGTGVYFVVDALGGSETEEAGLFTVSVDGKWGYIDRAGTIVIQPGEYDWAGDFSEGLATVSVDGKAGFIDESGEMVIQPRFDAADSFHEGLAQVWIGEKPGFIDRTGEMVIQPRGFVYAGYFSEGLAVVALADGDQVACGYIDKTGAITIEPQFAEAGSFSEGKARVYVTVGDGSQRCGFIDKTGAFVIQPQFAAASDFSEGLAAAAVYDGDNAPLWGYIDKAGRWAITPKFSDSRDFSEGLAVVGVEDETDGVSSGQEGTEGLHLVWPNYSFNKYGYIDRSGTFVIEPLFDVAEPFTEGLAAVGVGGGTGDAFFPGSAYSPLSSAFGGARWGYIDDTGAWVIEPQFAYAAGFKMGLAMVGLTDPDLEVEEIPSDRDLPGYTPVQFLNAYIDRTGKVIWRDVWGESPAW